MELLTSLERRGRTTVLLMAFVLIGTVGALDFFTGYEIAFSSFYLLPVSLTAWLTTRRLGLLVSFSSACVWLLADASSGHPYSHPLIPVWNTLIRLSFFVIVTLLVVALRAASERERALARTDYLTGAANARLFQDLVQMEVDRVKRYGRAFTVVYFDLDNFKVLNDQQGHAAGDLALKAVVATAQKFLRKTDVVARLGGDEFALLLPETDNPAAVVVVTRLRSGLLDVMGQNNWPVAFSMGALTCVSTPPTTDLLLKVADELMYSVKRAGKNGVQFSSYGGDTSRVDELRL